MESADGSAAASEEKVAESTAESGESLARRKAGCGRLMGTLRFQYRITAALAVKGFGALSLAEASEAATWCRAQNGKTSSKMKKNRAAVAVAIEAPNGRTGSEQGMKGGEGRISRERERERG